jgi:hypothetical protein
LEPEIMHKPIKYVEKGFSLMAKGVFRSAAR